MPTEPRRLWITHDVPVAPSIVWSLLVDPDRWPDWGPSVRRARLDDRRLRAGATGTVTTAVGLDLDFTIDRFEPGASWSWSVAGVPATDHRVEPAGSGSRVGIGVPWFAAPYLVVCWWGLRRLARAAVADVDGSGGPAPTERSGTDRGEEAACMSR